MRTRLGLGKNVLAGGVDVEETESPERGDSGIVPSESGLPKCSELGLMG
jgi:hypothetical protein